MAASDADVTELLGEWDNRSPQVEELLFPLVYDELRKIARAHLRRERSDHTLQPTALVNEAYLRLVDQDRVEWKGRAHFFGIASQMMRRILVDHARKRNAARRGAGAARVTLDEGLVAGERRSIDLVALDGALDRLAEVDPDQGRLVELRFFGGLTIDETSAVMGVSPATVKREWATARAWLYRELHGAGA
jgi:RNA polymerase sigma factor (TIGR02999 family)